MKVIGICILFLFVTTIAGCGSENSTVNTGDTIIDNGEIVDDIETEDNNDSENEDPDSGDDTAENIDSENDGSNSEDGNDTSTEDEEEIGEIELGSRAEWLSGSWGVAWLPEYYQNGGIEGISIAPFLEQVADFKTLDFIQVKLNDGSTFSPVHTSPNKLLESFWYDDGEDANENGNPVQNLVVPRWGDGEEPEFDPLMNWLVSIKEMGFRTQIYMNTGNMVRSSTPDAFPDVQERWMEWCDTDVDAQEYLNSESYRTAAYDADTGDYTDTSYSERAYMFCYLEFVLKDYAIRYGDLIDAWVFDNGGMISGKGDEPYNPILEEQRIYEAFADAVHAGNPYAALAFNNGPNRDDDDLNPYSPATLFDDYMFGHPFGGSFNHASKTNGLYEKNYRFVQWNLDTNGKIHVDDPDYDADSQILWDDKVIGHYYPKMAIESWNGGSQAYEDDDFNQWNREFTQAGASVVWGVALNRANCANAYGPSLTAKPWAIDQLTQLDEHLSTQQLPGAPNWARANTLLPEATIGQSYYHVLVEGEDFWDPEGDDITALTIVAGDGAWPEWLSITEDPNNPGQWIFYGMPIEAFATSYTFTLNASDSSAGRAREVELVVISSEDGSSFEDLDTGQPVWASELMVFNAYKFTRYSETLIQGRDFIDFEGDDVELTLIDEPEWLTIEEAAPGWWVLTGSPDSDDAGVESFQILLSDGVNSSTGNVELTVGDAQYISLINNSIWTGFWTALTPQSDNGEWTYDNHHKDSDRRAILYSEQTFQSDDGFKLTVDYTLGSIKSTGGNNFSFGLVSTDTDMSSYDGFNPFQADLTVYSLGVNLTATSGDFRGLNFTDGTALNTLDIAGTNQQFVAGSSTTVVIEITPNGVWRYSIAGTEEASGVMADGFDLSKSYRVVVFGQDDNGNAKSLQKVALDLL